jgi:hypothetical protein
VVEVSNELGNSPEVCLKAYAGTWAECGIEDRKPAEQAITDARAPNYWSKIGRKRGDIPKP